MFSKTRERAHGRWRGILASMGVSSEILNGRHQSCPLCRGGTDRFRYTDFKGNGEYYCSQCQPGDGFAFLMKLKGWDFKMAAEEVDKIVGTCNVDERKSERGADERREALRSLYKASGSVTRLDPAGAYLNDRCSLIEYPAALRYAPYVWHNESGKRLPAMLAIVSAPDGTAVQIHRTYLTERGAKADVTPVRAMMPGPIVRGSAVRLEPAGEKLGIAEGIETALSASVLTGIPCWSALNAEMLKAWEPPAEVKEVVIFGDNDENYTGQAAAFELARRLALKGVQATIEVPKQIGWDWNDVHRSHAPSIA